MMPSLFAKEKHPRPMLRVVLSILFVLAIVLAYFAYRWFTRSGGRTTNVIAWIQHPEEQPDWAISAGMRCGDAPFQMPTSGYIGYLWDDSFRPGHRHQGIDIFGGTEPGIIPIYAAYSGYLTRGPDWKSSLIIRIPHDPLKPSRQIWTYYTHLASPSGKSFIVSNFPPGSSDVYIEAGTLLGYQGNYSGDPNNPTGVHLHFSIVLDDGNGKFLNELKIKNTLDPSPYFGLPLNANENSGKIPLCDDE
ncbi:MAG: M23 family metallopeptidase [Chloroflexota bacterium]|nr:M23 family metallopeptidase [Chloroflexota bacterium]